MGRFQRPIDFLRYHREVFSIHIDDYAYVKVQGVRNIVDYSAVYISTFLFDELP